jgi:raffinose/stachyose/melibiose transport system permease protein
VILSIISVFVAYPLIWIFLLSFKNNLDLFTGYSFGLPQVWRVENYAEALSQYDFPKYFRNSSIVVSITVGITLFLSVMLAYGLSRMKFRGSSAIQSLIALGLVIPVQIVILPLYVMQKNLGLGDSLFSVILPYSAFNLSISVLLLYAFLKTLPVEIEEAAVLDGCSILRSFFRIVVPSIKSALATLAVYLVIMTWNEFFMALIFLRRDDLKTIPLGILNFISNKTDWGPMAASLIITCIPTVVVFLIFNKQIENALSVGSTLK